MGRLLDLRRGHVDQFMILASISREESKSDICEGQARRPGLRSEYDARAYIGHSPVQILSAFAFTTTAISSADLGTI